MLADTALQRLERIGREHQKKFVKKQRKLNIKRARYAAKSRGYRRRMYHVYTGKNNAYTLGEYDGSHLLYVNGPISFRDHPTDAENIYFNGVGRTLYNVLG